ncbi:proton-coupled amino acid transporter-like protein pathetic isoform X2 [Plodia interpunctella]|nr:proton-coupled amino acid transporter-like protein pathetic isoform X2 [Plodia interpunctella]XP_053620915.1 proton-coupled amino acid transporter-like protein pathetic isoform X2 [Plodia interpunctella]
MHEAFKYGGMVASVVGSVAVGLLLSLTMSILVRSAQKMYQVLRVSRLSYADLCEAAIATGPYKNLRRFSKTFRYMLECFIFLQITGTCSIYQIIIASTIKMVTEHVCPNFNVHLSLRTYIFIITIPLLVICLIRKWKYLAPISIVADLFLAICIITTMFYSMSEARSLKQRPPWKSVSGTFKFLGICLYSMDGFTLVLPIENNMKSPHHVRFVIHCGMAIVFLAVTLTGFFGYWGWGENCTSPITLHLPMETIPIILQFLLSAMLAATFAIQFWVPFRIVWRYIGKTHDYGFGKRNRWERFYRVLYLLFITCLSIVFPKPENLMIFLGSFFVSFNSFIFPSLIETLVVWRQYRQGQIRWAVVKDCGVCAVGLAFCIGGMYSLYI